MKKGKPNQTERGITLIALAVMIIILLILTAVVIKAVTGEEAILDTSMKATDEHNIIQYREQVSALRDSIILKYEMTGENITLEKLAREINGETTWIKKAVANLDKEETNEDIVVTTVDGYIYQLYYSEDYGQRYIEYIGREDGRDFPTVIAKYEPETSNIVVVANVRQSETVELIEIIHKGEIIAIINENNNLNKEIQKSGWYTIRVTAKDGKQRYAWIRVASTIVEPNIEITEHGEGEPENNWYGKSNQPAKATITSASERVAGIYYTIDNWKTENYQERKNSTNRRNQKSTEGRQYMLMQ